MENKNNLIMVADEVKKETWLERHNIPKKYIWFGIFAIILGIIIYIILEKPYASKFVCSSGNIELVLKHYDDKVVSLKKVNIDFEIKPKTDELEMLEYLRTIDKEFYKKTGEYCLNNGELLPIDAVKPNVNNPNSEFEDGNAEVGNEYYGYIDIPSTWLREYDPESEALTFSNGEYRVSLVYREDYDMSALEFFDEYKMLVEEDSNNQNIIIEEDVINGTRSHVISYYNVENKRYFSFYTFEDSEGGLYYMTLDGPTSLDRYTYIVKSYRRDSKSYR